MDCPALQYQNWHIDAQVGRVAVTYRGGDPGELELNGVGCTGCAGGHAVAVGPYAWTCRLTYTPGSAMFLDVRVSGQVWRVSPTEPPALLEAPDRVAAPPALVAEREAICAGCPNWANSCTIAGCACVGLGVPSALLSKCPLNKWPLPVLADAQTESP